MDILSAPDLPRSLVRQRSLRSHNIQKSINGGRRRRAFDRGTFIDVCPMPNDCCHRRLGRTEQIHGHKKQKSMPAGPRIGSERHQRTNEPCASHGAVTKLSRWTRPSSLAVKFAFKWRILNVLCLSEMNYAEKRLGIPTKCYFQLQSRREFGFM